MRELSFVLLALALVFSTLADPIPAPTATASPTPFATPTPEIWCAGTVTSALSLRIRSGPSPQAAVIGSLLPGTTVRLIGEQDGWLQIAAGGWISAAYVAVQQGCLP